MTNNTDNTDTVGAVEGHNGRWFVREVVGEGPYRARFKVIAAHPVAGGEPVLDGYWHELERVFDSWNYAADAALEAAQRAIDFRS
ncbi:hypothetical protein CDN99_06435 [Roseateles aquatilis]|uniref:Uncharacterized protein n=1 Tax=Roseateles aquatilis TaxID=431061 RepID=A0A246JHJ8_9BURK|nr:hypothetical protein [Roseateles aquatilis]OWQ91993.1 hypothetical protein CDN99_06435 [Roseateles aquatilis]